MKRYAFSLFFVVAVSFMLLGVYLSYAEDGRDATALAGSQAQFLTPAQTLPNFDQTDTWRVKCVNGNGAIRADINPFGPFNDNAGYVTVACKNRNRSEMEFAPGGNVISAFASVANCLEALVVYHCDNQTACDESYDSIIECVGRNFAAGFPVRTQDSP